MPRINSALFAKGQKPRTRDRKKTQDTFDFDPEGILTARRFRNVTKNWGKVPAKPQTWAVPPGLMDIATDIMEGNLTTSKWADEEDTNFDPEAI